MYLSHLDPIFILQGEKYASLIAVAALEMEILSEILYLLALFCQLYIPQRCMVMCSLSLSLSVCSSVYTKTHVNTHTYLPILESTFYV